MRQASDMLGKLRIPHGYVCEVMSDTRYLNEQVTETIRRRGRTRISRCADNRPVLREGGKKRQNLQAYVSAVKWQNLKYKTDRKRPAVVGHQRIGHLKNIGRVKIVLSPLIAGGKGKSAFFCTDSTGLQMVNVISRFEKRWKTEVFFKEARKCFGFSKWQYQDIVSVVHHLCLTIVAAIACACVRLRESEDEKSGKFGSWGEFVGRLRKKNQRLFPEYFLEKSGKEKYSDFDKLCSDLGI